jgi:8-oxo-dGTP diphosphatase
MDPQKRKGRAAKVSPRRKAAPASPLLSIAPDKAREFPDYPRVGVGGIVVHEGHVLLVRRGQAPLKNRWSIPGGLIEVGERLTDAVKREIKEETGLEVEPVQIMGIFERIERDPKPGRHVRYHYVIVDYLCRLRRSQARDSRPPKLQPASDITEAEWAEGEMLSLYKLSAEAGEVILKAMELVDPDW